MWEKLLVAAALVVPATFALAQSASQLRQSYAGRGEGEIDLRIIVLDDEAGVVAADVDVAAPGCVGLLAGIGQMRGNVLELKPYKADGDGKACVVSVTFDKTGKKATISESGCLYFHGFACAFEGKLTSPR